MNFFSQFWSEKLHNTLPRKHSITYKKTLIYGPPKSGKTSLAFDFALSLDIPHKFIVYFDLKDCRISQDEAKQELLKLYLEKKVRLLIIDNYDPSFTLPHIDYMILISSNNLSIPSFESVFCPALTFVEYLSFFSKNTSTETMFKNFIKDGNLPQIPMLWDYQKTQHKQEILKLSLLGDFDLFCKLIPFQSQKITTFQFFSILKKIGKISKDKTYLFIESLEKNGLIFFIPHIQATKPKKLYFYDFSISRTLSLQSMIIPILENMFVLELKSIYKTIHYDDFGCFITPKKERFLFLPFAQRDVIQKKLSKIKKMPNDETLKIITLDFSDSSITHGINWEALSFVEFVLGELE